MNNLDKQAQKHIYNYLKDTILNAESPKDFGKPLGNLKAGLWRYRVDKYRIICQIQDKEMLILVVKIGKRDKVYE